MLSRLPNSDRVANSEVSIPLENEICPIKKAGLRPLLVRPSSQKSLLDCVKLTRSSMPVISSAGA